MARYRRTSSPRLLTIVVLLLLAAVRWWSGRDPNGVDESAGDGLAGGAASPADAMAPGEYRVVRVVDGDTLILGRQKQRVRLQGVDAPETVKEDWPVEPWGPEASEFTRRFVDQAGGALRMEVDGETHDKYGRALGFLWHDGRMLNEQLVRNGLARAKLGYDYSQDKKNLLKQAQRDAQRARRGIWSSP